MMNISVSLNGASAPSQANASKAEKVSVYKGFKMAMTTAFRSLAAGLGISNAKPRSAAENYQFDSGRRPDAEVPYATVNDALCPLSVICGKEISGEIEPIYAEVYQSGMAANPIYATGTIALEAENPMYATGRIAFEAENPIYATGRIASEAENPIYATGQVVTEAGNPLYAGAAPAHVARSSPGIFPQRHSAPRRLPQGGGYPHRPLPPRPDEIGACKPVSRAELASIADPDRSRRQSPGFSPSYRNRPLPLPPPPGGVGSKPSEPR